MNETKLLGMLGLARRAGKLAVGTEQAVAAVRRRCPLVIAAEDASPNTKKLLTDKTTYYHVPMFTVMSREELGGALGYPSVSAAAVTDEGFAQGIIGILRGECV